MDIFIRWGKEDSKGFKLPINPTSYKIDGKQQNTSVNIHASGEINLKGKRALKTVSWSSFFPSEKYVFAKTKLNDPINYYVKKLVEVMDKNTTIHLVLGQSINIFGTIESFSWGQDSGSGDINYDISIKEQRILGSAEPDNFSGDYIVHRWKKDDTWQKVYKKLWGRDSTRHVYEIPGADPKSAFGRLNGKTAYYSGPSLNILRNKKTINAAMKAYSKKHPKTKKVNMNVALIGYDVKVWW